MTQIEQAGLPRVDSKLNQFLQETFDGGMVHKIISQIPSGSSFFKKLFDGGIANVIISGGTGSSPP